MSDYPASETREAIEALKAALGALPRAWFPSGTSHTAAMLQKLGAGERPPRPPQEAHLEALRARLRALFAAGPPAAPPEPRDLRDAPWILWSGKPPAAGFPGLLPAVLAQAAGHGRTLRNLAEAWVRDFDPKLPGLRETGSALARLIAASVDHRLGHWREAQALVGLFDAEHGPKRLAERLLRGPEAVGEILERCGFADPARATGAYMLAVQRAALATLPPLLRQAPGPAGTALRRAQAFLAPASRLRFPEERGPMAAGLVAAWLGGAAPDAALRDEVQEFLLHHLGDPRLKPQNWTAAGEEVVRLVRGWLARASLETFFRLIDEHALDRHWRYREAFWSACLQKGAIDDAWLVLGRNVHASARAIRALGSAYGCLSGSSDPNHAVLLMRIGPLVLCEWSHNGRLRAWPADWRQAPQLGCAGYDRDELVVRGLPFPDAPEPEGLTHRGSESGLWQGRAAKLLAKRAGLHLTPTDWQPR